MWREFLRLTIRGELRLRVRLARKVAATSSSAWNQRDRFFGRCGGKGPGQGLLLADQLDMPDERQVLVRDPVSGSPLGGIP